MKITDIKGDVGKSMAYWVQDYVNNLVFGEINKVAPSLVFHDHISLYRMEDFKKLLSGKRIGYITHGCEDFELPWSSWYMSKPQSVYCKDPIKINNQSIDVNDDEGLFKIEVDIVDRYGDGHYWQVVWSIVANRPDLLKKLEDLFGKDVEKVKTAIHKDYKGQTMKVGDIICYSTTTDNGIRLGTIDKFNDYSMVVDGHDVQYDARVLVVNKEIRYNEQTKKYEHR